MKMSIAATPLLKDIDGHVLTQFIFQLPLEITLPL